MFGKARSVFVLVTFCLRLGAGKFDYLNPDAAARIRLKQSNKFGDDRMGPNQIRDDFMDAKQVRDDVMQSNEVGDVKAGDDAGKATNDDKISETGKEVEANLRDNEFIVGFIDSYVEEHELEISGDLVIKTLQHLQESSEMKFTGANLPQLFVQMGSLIDVLAALEKQTDDVDQVVEEQIKKIGRSAQSKDVFQTLTSNLKSELVNLMLKGPKKSPPLPQAKKQKTDSGMSDLLQIGSKLLQGGGDGQNDLLQLGSKLIQGGGAGHIASLLGGEGMGNMANLLGGEGAGKSELLQIGSKLLQEGGAGKIANLLGGDGIGQVVSLLGGDREGQMANFLKSGGAKKIANFLGGDISSLDSSKMDLLSKMAQDYMNGTPWDVLLKKFGKNFLSSEYGLHTLTQGTGLFKSLSSSETGKRLLLAAPKLVSAEDLNTVLNILSKEAEWNWGKFFGHIDNNVYKKMVMYQISGYILEAQQAFQDPANKDILANIEPTLNRVLVSRNLPLLDLKNPIETISAIANKGIYIATKKKIDISPYISSTVNAVQHAFKNKMRGIAFHEYTKEEKKLFITEALDKDVWLPLHKVWETLERLRQAVPSCSSHLLCSVNRDGIISAKEEGHRVVVEGASLVAAWIIHQRKAEAGHMYNMYKAVMAGAKGQDCDQLFPSFDDSCSLHSWRSRGHIEL